MLLVTGYLLLVTPSPAVAQGDLQFGLASRFGPHLACSNQTDFIEKVRKNYQFLGWSDADWIPATIMFKITDPPDYIRAGLEAMAKDFEETPKLWPIVRVDGDPHGDRISSAQIDQFRETLRTVGGLAALGEKPLFFEFANEPNHQEEWKPAINPQDYQERLADFIREIGVIREIGGFRVVNAALDQRAGDSPTTMEGVVFWNAGNLVSIVGSLDGYAFNNYHFESTGRYSKEGWKVMRQSLGMTEGKPVFLVEYGLDPGADSGARISFLQQEYELDLTGVNPAVAEVAAVTPLFCLDDNPADGDSCPKKNTAIFGTEGEVLFMEQDEAGSCGGLLSCCGLPAAIRTAKCAKEVSECRARAMLPAKLVGKAGFKTAAGVSGLGGSKDVAGVSTLGVRERICGLLDRIPGWVPGVESARGVLCEFAEVSDHLAQFENPQEVGEKIGEPEVPELPPEPPARPTPTPEGYAPVGLGIDAVRTQGIDFNPVDWLWGIISPRTVEEKTGWLGQYKFGTLANEAANVEALGGTEGEVIGEFERTRQKLTPYKLLKAYGDGGGRDREITCEPATSGDCTVDNLRPYFSSYANEASIICNAESGGNPEAVNDGCLAGISPDFSIGLFQINMLAHYCPEVFASYTLDPPFCTIADGMEDRLRECVGELKNPQINISEAVRISSGGTNWSPWATAKVCGIN